MQGNDQDYLVRATAADAQIRAFAESNEINLPKGNSVKVGELRDLLAAALRADSKE